MPVSIIYIYPISVYNFDQSFLIYSLIILQLELYVCRVPGIMVWVYVAHSIFKDIFYFSGKLAESQMVIKCS